MSDVYIRLRSSEVNQFTCFGDVVKVDSDDAGPIGVEVLGAISIEVNGLLVPTPVGERDEPWELDSAKPAEGLRAEIAWLRARIDAALAICAEYEGTAYSAQHAVDRLRAALSGPAPTAKAPLSDFPLQEFLEEEGPLAQPPSRSTSRRSGMKPVRLSGPVPTTKGTDARSRERTADD